MKRFNKTSGPFNELGLFFERFKTEKTVADLHKKFHKTTGRIKVLQSIYEACVKITENEAVNSGFKKEFIKLQRDLYLELEQILASVKHDNRHSFFVVIPVAERPLMLKSCLDSLLEQCRIFQYGGFSIREKNLPSYNKISIFIMDDSKEKTNIRKIKKLAVETTKAGIKTYYFGLKEQTRLLEQIPEHIRNKLTNLLGDSDFLCLPHKGASVIRNLAYLYLNAIVDKTDEKTLIYFMDSDEEFRISIKSPGKNVEIPFINYFYWLDRIFSDPDIEILTGKVVGDPPVSPSVMINTFLDDVIFFFDSITGLNADDKCIFHKTYSSEKFSAEYHDMVKLFGYSSPLSPKEYSCSFTGKHTIKDCFKDFADKLLEFFSGVHPTRTQFYSHNGDFTKTENARTVYTGNYVMSSEGLENFIPFASLKLRMAGPTLGRILRSRLKGRFRSANLPLLHKRTILDKHADEFRTGILRDEDTIDLSGEFIKQFCGDVMLFSVDELTESGYPDKEIGLRQITGIVNKTCDNLHRLYMEQQAETYEKILRLKNYLKGPSFWWNTSPAISGSLKNFQFFCSTVENNFGPESPVMKELSEQIKTKIYSKEIIQAIHSFHENEIYWKKALTFVCQESTKPTSKD
jgi:glycosyltransferase involved in cell wall biosynthesis